jgi:hypothetical protein
MRLSVTVEEYGELVDRMTMAQTSLGIGHMDSWSDKLHFRGIPVDVIENPFREAIEKTRQEIRDAAVCDAGGPGGGNRWVLPE